MMSDHPRGLRAWSAAEHAPALLLALLLASTGCGLQESFRRPPRKQTDDPLRVRKLLQQSPRSTEAGYARAYASWYADQDSLQDRLSDSPKVVGEIYERLMQDLKLMQNYMYRKEADEFLERVVNTYEMLLSPWPNGASRTLIERRLESLEGLVRRKFAPGIFPLRDPGSPVEEPKD